MPSDRPADSPGAVRSIVVVGAGLAGARTVTALRDAGFGGAVTLLGAEGLEPYDRPPLSKELLTRTEPAWLRDELGTDLTSAEVRLAEPATGLAVDPTSVTVTTAGGEVVADAAVLATGSHAVRPPGWEHALTLHTAADAARLRAAVVAGSRLVVVGAGWIGAEVAGIAAAAGAHVTVVEAAPAPLSAALGRSVGTLTAPWYAAAGVQLLCGVGVTRITEEAVELADGQALQADVVLAAVGARPHSGWLGDALPVTADGALAVGSDYRVIGTDGVLAHVAAVGDLARRRSPRHGWVPGGHWDGALRGPDQAVRSLLGLETPGAAPAEPADPAPYVFSTQLGHELGLYGQPGPEDDVVLRGDPSAAFTALWFVPGTETLTAVLAVDTPRDVGAARKLFTGPLLPQLDRAVAVDPAVPLRRAARG